MATTVVSWIVTSAIDAFNEAQNELNRPAPSRTTPRAISNAKCDTIPATFTPLPDFPPELQNIIISFVPPSKLWTQFRLVSKDFKYTIEEILAPRWLKEGHLTLYLQLDDLTMKDFKSMLANGMAYGPDFKGPYCLDKLKEYNDEHQKSLQFNLNPSITQGGRIAHFDFVAPPDCGRDARRDKLSRKIGSMPGNTMALSFCQYVPDRSIEAIALKEVQYSLSPHCDMSLPPRLSLPPSVSSLIRDAISWETMSIELDYRRLLTMYFKEVEKTEARGSVQGTTGAPAGGKRSWARWYATA
ncbi:hypothetical protein FRB94_001458 [Tulasnella sp. JGI-2019a]|nr:hypothetical protein FRB93_003653 [Tulasnella sp. JGI-2019a]KAG9005531.1 hypothetical protein FRB94_001458 [Tulasnella sp. JGI-2019a]KAG9032507.1 hypothetical protein FRB95_001414 [Tulasnella sp. JGI-2019a]